MRIKGYDGVRGLAAVSVVLTHLHVYKTLVDDAGVGPGLVWSIDGSAAVQAFFVLSGLIITHLILRERRATGGFGLRDFFIRRALRILPVYYVVVIATALLSLADDRVSNPVSTLFAATFLYNFIPNGFYVTTLGHTWSIAVEEQFYLLWPFLLLALGFDRRRILAALLAATAGSVLAAQLLLNWEWLTARFFVDRWIVVSGINLAFGCMAALLLERIDRDPATRAAVLRLSAPLGAAALALVLHAAVLGVTEYWSALVRGVGFALAYVWIFVRQESAVVEALEAAPLRYLGAVSYGIYMYQGFFLGTGPERAPGQLWPPSQEIGLIMLVVVVPLSHRFIEKPLLALKTRFAFRPTSARFAQPESPSC